MICLGDRSGRLFMKCLFSNETNCNFKFAAGLDKQNLTDIFEHIYLRHAPMYQHITNDFDVWYRNRMVSTCEFIFYFIVLLLIRNEHHFPHHHHQQQLHQQQQQQVVVQQ
jgi:hypothetical protein